MGVPQVVQCHSMYLVSGLIPGRGEHPGCGLDPKSGACGRQQIDVSLCH